MATLFGMQAASVKKHRLGEITRKQFLVNKITQIAHNNKALRNIWNAFCIVSFSFFFHLHVFWTFYNFPFFGRVYSYSLFAIARKHTPEWKIKIKQWDLNEHKMKSNSRNTHKTAAMRKIVWLENWKINKTKQQQQQQKKRRKAKENEFFYMNKRSL